MSFSTTRPSSAAAPAELGRTPAEPHRQGPRLTGAGGTDPHRWPLTVPRHPGEAFESWLGRLAHRYGLTPRATLRLLGAAVLPQRLLRLAPLLESVGLDTITDKLGLEPASLAPDPLLDTLERTRRDYLDRFHAYPQLEPKGLRFCAACLDEDGYWQASWASPLHAVCVRHGKRLASTCAQCGNVPFESPVWLTSVSPTRSCPGLFEPSRTPGARYRPRCGADLGEGVQAGLSAAPDEVAAQQYVLGLAHATVRGEESRRCCGMDVTPTLALEAVLDLIHAQVASRFYLTSPSEPVERLADAMTVAVDIAAQPNPTAAHERAQGHGLLRPHDPQAPLGPTSAIRARPHSRVLETTALLAHADRLSIDNQLKYRIGSDMPAYPAQQRHPRDTNHLRADQGLPELPMSAIPTRIWPGLLDDAPAAAREGENHVLVRAAASLALAKTASNRKWRLLATDLGLPAAAASPIRRYWHTLRRDRDDWRAYLGWIERLFVRLHHDPPPIDYQLRRAVAADHAFLTSCARDVLSHGDHPKPDGLGPTALVRAFWPVYTESDLTLAAAPAPPPDPKAARVLRRLNARSDTLHPWLERMNARVAAEVPGVGGLLSWQPP